MARFKAFESEDDEDDRSSAASEQAGGKEVVHDEFSRPSSPLQPLSEDEIEDQELGSQGSEGEEGDGNDGEGTDESEPESVEDELQVEGTSEAGDTDEDNHEAVPWAEQLHLEPQRVHVMQTSLFRMPELTQAAQEMQKPQPSGSWKHLRTTELVPPPKSRQFGTRTSFAEPRAVTPSRKYIRVSSSSSVSASHEGAFADAGLSFGRSFRVGWGPGGRLAHLGKICAPGASSNQSANSSIVHITSVPLSNPGVEGSPDLLSHLLAHTPITAASIENKGIPSVIPNRSLTFASFASLFEPHDTSHVACLFRLGHALFDPLHLHLPHDANPDIRNRVHSLRRVNEFSSWLARGVAPKVERDLKDALSITDAASRAARTAYIHLTGHQIDKAVDVLANGGNIRLATLVSQAPGDDEFRSDIQDQLQIWKDEKVDAFMGEDVRRIYALLGGVVDVLEGSSRKEDIEVGEGLDWLRTFGLRFWYAGSFERPLREAFEAYQQSFQDHPNLVPPPKSPWSAKWVSDSGTHTSLYPSTPSSNVNVNDGLFSVIKLALQPSMTLESTLVPNSFGPNPRDFKLPWFIFVLLSRCLRLRDFTDRTGVGDGGADGDSVLRDSGEDDNDGWEIEGGKVSRSWSATADSLTSSFAAQLEQARLIQEAIFVLLFLENDVGRKHAIKSLLSRSAHLLDEWNTAGINGSLKIPQQWINEAKATHAFYQGRIYEAYDLYTEAGVHKVAHDLAITYIAPEAILRDDLELLRRLFEGLDQSKISDWGVGGKLFLDYTTIVTRVPELQSAEREIDTVMDASERLELQTLMGRIPLLIGVLPDVLKERPDARCSGSRSCSSGTSSDPAGIGACGSRDGGKAKAALSTMLANLLDCLDVSRPVKIEIPPGVVDEAARLRHIQASAHAGFLRSIEALA